MGFFLLFIPGILAIVDFFAYLFRGRRMFTWVLDVFVVIITPVLYLWMFDFGQENDCCTESAVFSPAHRLSIYAMVGLIMACYFMAISTTTLRAPIIEIILNAALFAGIILNAFIAYHEISGLSMLGNIPIIMLFIMALHQRQCAIIAYVRDQNPIPSNRWEKWSWAILTLEPITRNVLLFLLALPLTLILTSILLLFGQKPDSIVRAFTETYHQGLSQWDYKCAEVKCDRGHYLCSVAAQGHPAVVKPQRMGIRHGSPIICNRQLLVSNAFEEALAERFPQAHRVIRKNYDKIGHIVHRHYHVFEHKIICDIVYLLMKPLEWLFLIALYAWDINPENRIARQYTGTRTAASIPQP